jgi:hypothetical protein
MCVYSLLLPRQQRLPLPRRRLDLAGSSRGFRSGRERLPSPGSLPLAKRGRFARASSSRGRPEASSAALLSGTWAEHPARFSGGRARGSSALARLRRPGVSSLPGRRRLISAQSTIRRPPCVRSRRAGRRGCRSAGATGARPEHQRRARGRRPTRSSSSCHTAGAISAFVSAKPRAATPRTRPPRSPSHHSRGADGTCRRARGFGCVHPSWAFPHAGRSAPRQCFALAGAEYSATRSYC